MAKRAREAFAFQDGDHITVVSSDDLYADDHPYVRARPDMFVDPLANVIEAATAAPGERRITSRGKPAT
jgi:hypothetical protein